MKSTKLAPGVKARVEDMKKALHVKSESEVIAYLCALYDRKYQYITLPEHGNLLKDAREMQNQFVI